jgi:A nuclease family of the HNH/ENDO VII superfamily with conserved AHH
MEAGEPVGVGVAQCSVDCPFCKDKKYLGYMTKRGDLKDERVLAANLRSSTDIASDKAVGNVYPLPGGNDSTTGWQAAAGALEDRVVGIAAAPHHLIPGKASMAPSRLETWTCAGDKLKEDIGYNIDCAQNGIFLPHLPEIYWTRHYPGTDIPMSRYFGQTWARLSKTSKQSIGFLVMNETIAQMHYTDHDDPYQHVDNETTYDDECKLECNHLADLMQLKDIQAKCKDDDGKLAPPYTLVSRINTKSRKIQGQITGYPVRWTSWVSPLAQDLTHELKQDPRSPLSRSKGLIRKLEA